MNPELQQLLIRSGLGAGAGAGIGAGVGALTSGPDDRARNALLGAGMGGAIGGLGGFAHHDLASLRQQAADISAAPASAESSLFSMPGVSAPARRAAPEAEAMAQAAAAAPPIAAAASGAKPRAPKPKAAPKAEAAPAPKKPRAKAKAKTASDNAYEAGVYDTLELLGMDKEAFIAPLMAAGRAAMPSLARAGQHIMGGAGGAAMKSLRAGAGRFGKTFAQQAPGATAALKGVGNFAAHPVTQTAVMAAPLVMGG